MASILSLEFDGQAAYMETNPLCVFRAPLLSKQTWGHMWMKSDGFSDPPIEIPNCGCMQQFLLYRCDVEQGTAVKCQ